MIEGERVGGKVSASLVTLILVSTVAMTFYVGPVKASGPVYIRADGTIDPPTAPIMTLDNVTYVLTGNITSDVDGIVVERDSIALDGAGYTLQGTRAPWSRGVNVSGRTNITVRNAHITNFYEGIRLDFFSSNNSISGNTITANSGFGIWLSDSNSNSVSGNTITANPDGGIMVDHASNSSINGNTITDSWTGIYLSGASYSSVRGNIVAGNMAGIGLSGSFYNSVSGNNVTANRNGYGIMLGSSSYNNVSGNIIADNMHGIDLSFSSNNSISGNTITADNFGYGIWLEISSNNSFCHNNFIDNGQQVSSEHSINAWDDGYPSGGNYWSTCTDADTLKGPYQNETGSDHVWDHSYLLDADNQDRYPLTQPYGAAPAGDVDGDRDVDLLDIVQMASVYRVAYPNPQYDRRCDLDLDGDVDLFDVVKAAANYGQSW
jgi:parallel beta-helix repeat protein